MFWWLWKASLLAFEVVFCVKFLMICVPEKFWLLLSWLTKISHQPVLNGQFSGWVQLDIGLWFLETQWNSSNSLPHVLFCRRIQLTPSFWRACFLSLWETLNICEQNSSIDIPFEVYDCFLVYVELITKDLCCNAVWSSDASFFKIWTLEKGTLWICDVNYVFCWGASLNVVVSVSKHAAS